MRSLLRRRAEKRLVVGLAGSLLLLGLHASPVAAQSEELPTAAESPPAAVPASQSAPDVLDFSKPMGPPDPLNRGTPRGSMYGFFRAARSGDYEQAARHLDLRQFPPEERERAPELARYLKVVLDQTLWVDLASLSDSNDGIPDDGLPSWQDRLGNIMTSQGDEVLLLQRVGREGDGVRIWKVSATTVARIPDLYAEFEPVWLEEWLPRVFFEVELQDVVLWKWLGLLGVLVGSLLFAMLIAGSTTRVLGLLFTRGRAVFDPRIAHLVRGPVGLAWAVILFALGRNALGLPLEVVETLRVAERLLFVVAVTWGLFRLIDLSILVLAARAEERGNTSLIPVLRPTGRFAKFIVVACGLLGVLGTLGVNVTAAVAGLGIGGIAFALAAQKSIEHLFGGVSLFADRPVQVGDFCRYGDQVGTVEEIGLRSTRIRTLDRTVVTIPNAEFSNLRLENYARRDRMRLYAMIGVRYETTPDQLRFLLARLRDLLIAHPRVTPDPSRVRLVGFGAYSIDIEVFAYIDTADWSEFLAIREELYLMMMEIIAKAGTGFAFPSTTTYLGRDGGLDGGEVRAAEARVAAWRANRELPFPNTPEAHRREIENTLPWPPEGSPESPKS